MTQRSHPKVPSLHLDIKSFSALTGNVKPSTARTPKGTKVTQPLSTERAQSSMPLSVSSRKKVVAAMMEHSARPYRLIRDERSIKHRSIGDRNAMIRQLMQRKIVTSSQQVASYLSLFFAQPGKSPPISREKDKDDRMEFGLESLSKEENVVEILECLMDQDGLRTVLRRMWKCYRRLKDGRMEYEEYSEIHWLIYRYLLHEYSEETIESVVRTDWDVESEGFKTIGMHTFFLSMMHLCDVWCVSPFYKEKEVFLAIIFRAITERDSTPLPQWREKEALVPLWFEETPTVLDISATPQREQSPRVARTMVSPGETTDSSPLSPPPHQRGKPLRFIHQMQQQLQQLQAAENASPMKSVIYPHPELSPLPSARTAHPVLSPRSPKSSRGSRIRFVDAAVERQNTAAQTQTPTHTLPPPLPLEVMGVGNRNQLQRDFADLPESELPALAMQGSGKDKGKLNSAHLSALFQVYGGYKLRVPKLPPAKDTSRAHFRGSPRSASSKPTTASQGLRSRGHSHIGEKEDTFLRDAQARQEHSPSVSSFLSDDNDEHEHDHMHAHGDGRDPTGFAGSDMQDESLAEEEEGGEGGGGEGNQDEEELQLARRLLSVAMQPPASAGDRIAATPTPWKESGLLYPVGEAGQESKGPIRGKYSPHWLSERLQMAQPPGGGKRKSMGDKSGGRSVFSPRGEGPKDRDVYDLFRTITTPRNHATRG